MTARLRSDLFVAALIRSVEVAGGHGAVVRKGFGEAGAVHVEWRWRGEVGLLSPAPQSMAADDGERRFMRVEAADEASIAERMASERRFDEEAWHVEIEGVDPATLLAIVEA